MTTNIKDEVWVERREDWKAGTADARDAAATDYARIVHSASSARSARLHHSWPHDVTHPRSREVLP
jgi:dGTP triphosphohydrolase